QVDRLVKSEQLPRTEQEGLGVVVAGEPDRNDHAGLHQAVIGSLFADLGAPQHVLELANSSLGLALLLLRSVIAAVLPQIAFVTRVADSRHELGTRGTAEMIQ